MTVVVVAAVVAVVIVTGTGGVITAAVIVVKLEMSVIAGTEGVTLIASDEMFVASSSAVLTVTIG